MRILSRFDISPIALEADGNSRAGPHPFECAAEVNILLRDDAIPQASRLFFLSRSRRVETVAEFAIPSGVILSPLRFASRLATLRYSRSNEAKGSDDAAVRGIRLNLQGEVFGQFAELSRDWRGIFRVRRRGLIQEKRSPAAHRSQIGRLQTARIWSSALAPSISSFGETDRTIGMRFLRVADPRPFSLL